GDAGPYAGRRGPGHGQQGGGRRGRGAVAVGPLGGDVLHVGRVQDGGQAAVGLHAEVVAGDVVPGDGGGDRHVDGDLGGRFGRPLAGQLGDRLGHHLAVEVEADGGDVAGLLATEEVAGAPDLEVAHGDLEPAAEVGELAEGLEP